MKKIVIFDLFGTLLSINSIAINISREEKVKLLTGKIRSSDINKADVFRQQKETVSLFPESINVLKKLSGAKGVKCYCISNLSEDFVSSFYDFNIDKYCTPIFSCRVGFIKPQKEIYRKVLDKNSAAENSYYMIGDSFKNDYLGAQKQGIQAYWLNRANSKTQSNSNPDRSLKNLIEFQNIILKDL